MAHKILVVDDEKAIIKGIRYSLEQDGMEVREAYDGEEGLALVKSEKFDLVLLDLMLPKIEGMDVCRQIREFSDVPVIILTAKDDDMDKIMGLESGADDYITKPFNILEVKARIKNILRRIDRNEKKEQKEKSIIVDGPLTMNLLNHRLQINGREISLTSREFALLELLITHPDQVYGREQLARLIWGEDSPGDVRTVDVHVRRLREKIEVNPGAPQFVRTKWGMGYYYRGFEK